MKDFSQLLVIKTDTILEQWVVAVSQDKQIETANHLTYKDIRNDMLDVLKAMTTVLSQSEDNDTKSVIEASLIHGVVRADQGYDPAEIAREYGLLRRLIFSTMEEGLLTGTPRELMRATRLIDSVIDAALAKCFKSYTEQRLTEVHHLQSQLALHNQELNRLVRANQDNLSYLAHELKNPLTSIIGYADLFLRQQRRKSEAIDTVPNLEHIERVLRNGRHLLRLINDALEISRYEAGKMQLEAGETDVCDVINKVVEAMEPLAQAKQLELVVDLKSAPKQAITDALRLQQVVTNLVSNAIRYTNSGKIEVTCQVLDEKQPADDPVPCFAIAVCDTGVGIESEDQKHIFEPYFQVGASAAQLPESTGLGLAIVSRLVKLLQGRIELVSQVGVGTTVTVIFPLEVKQKS